MEEVCNGLDALLQHAGMAWVTRALATDDAADNFSVQSLFPVTMGTVATLGQRQLERRPKTLSLTSEGLVLP